MCSVHCVLMLHLSFRIISIESFRGRRWDILAKREYNLMDKERKWRRRMQLEKETVPWCDIPFVSEEDWQRREEVSLRKVWCESDKRLKIPGPLQSPKLSFESRKKIDLIDREWRTEGIRGENAISYKERCREETRDVATQGYNSSWLREKSKK